jgi:hypothetical protein
VERKKRRSFSRGGTFLVGFFVGVLCSAFVVVGLAGYFIRYPQKIIVKAVDLGMNRVVEKTVQSIPRDFVSERQEEITASAQQFAQAFTQNRISQADMNVIAKKFFSVIADQKITPEEIDEILQLVNRYSM